ncbi:MAG: SGNH/GDSL hydrolase family protein [Bauldia sp.]
MPSLLCYGDSNTWGSATVTRPDGRYGPAERWPGIVRAALGPAWLVTEEGLGGRTTVSDDPVEGAEKNGLAYLLPCLLSHKPLDVIVIMLGTNDLKARFNKSPWEVAAGMAKLVELAKQPQFGRAGKPAEILVVSPPPFLPLTEAHAEMFAGAVEKSPHLAAEFRKVAATAGLRFFDAGSVIRSSKVDGFHLDPDAHAALGKAIAAEVTRIAL